MASDLSSVFITQIPWSRSELPFFKCSFGSLFAGPCYLDVYPSRALIRQNALCLKVNHYLKTLRSHLALFHGKPFKEVAWTSTTAVLDVYLALLFRALLFLICLSAKRWPCKIQKSLCWSAELQSSRFRTRSLCRRWNPWCPERCCCEAPVSYKQQRYVWGFMN